MKNLVICKKTLQVRGISDQLLSICTEGRMYYISDYVGFMYEMLNDFGTYLFVDKDYFEELNYDSNT